MRTSRLLAVSALAAALLAGCVPAPAPPADPGVPSASPTMDASARPQPTLAVGCAGLLALEAVQGQVVAEVSVVVDETTPIAGLEGSAQVQLGGMRCVWAGDDRTDTSYDDGLQLDILPDATQEFTTASSDASFDGMRPLDGLGDEAYLQCDTVVALCRAQVLVEGYWVSAAFSDSDYAGADPPAHAATAGAELLATAVDAIRAAPASGAVWRPRKGTPVCTDALAAPLAGALGVDPSGFTRAGTDEPLWTVGQAAARGLGVERCSWDDRTHGLGRLPGGGWAVEVAPDAVGEPFGDAAVIDEVDGVGPVAVACRQGCLAWFVHAGDLIEYAWYPDNDLAYREDMRNHVAAIASVLG